MLHIQQSCIMRCIAECDETMFITLSTHAMRAHQLTHVVEARREADGKAIFLK